MKKVSWGKQPPMQRIGCLICRLHLLLVVATHLKCLQCSAATAPWGLYAADMGGPDEQETEGLTVKCLLKHRASLHASITRDVHLDALKRIDV